MRSAQATTFGHGTQRGAGWGYSLWEFQVYARPHSICLPLVLRQSPSKVNVGMGQR
jgi:hypothetical protein